MIKVWISKYALTQGIFEIEAEICEGSMTGMVADINNRTFGLYHGEGREWHKTKEEASKRAEKMRLKKIASLKKQIEKLEKMDFNK